MAWKPPKEVTGVQAEVPTKHTARTAAEVRALIRAGILVVRADADMGLFTKYILAAFDLASSDP